MVAMMVVMLEGGGRGGYGVAAVGVTVAMITGTMVVTSVVAAVVKVMVVVMVMVEELAVTLVDVVVSSGMILSFQKARFSCFLKKRNGHTDGRTDIRTYGQRDGQTLL